MSPTDPPPPAPPAETPPLIGRSLADGKYAVGAMIGRGAMGEVYEASHCALDRRVAIKVLNPGMMQQPDAAERFRREALAASRIHHPHSMAILDFGQEDGVFYIVMEYLEGTSLGRLLQRDGPMGEERIVHLMSQALGALAQAHDSGIIHRDLKPDNIVVTCTVSDDGQTIESAKVCDFGIAKISESGGALETLTHVGAVSGTPHYMSPEQGSGRPLDARSDLYSCGVILYRMATGRTPFDGDNAMAVIYQHVTETPPPPRQLRPELSEALQAVILKALQKDPGRRYPDARTMRAALRAVVDGDELLAGQTSRPVPAGADVLGEAELVNAETVYDSDPKLMAHKTAGVARVASSAARGDIAGSVARTAVPARGAAGAGTRVRGAWAALALLALVGGGVWWMSQGAREPSVPAGAMPGYRGAATSPTAASGRPAAVAVSGAAQVAPAAAQEGAAREGAAREGAPPTSRPSGLEAVAGTDAAAAPPSGAGAGPAPATPQPDASEATQRPTARPPGAPPPAVPAGARAATTAAATAAPRAATGRHKEGGPVGGSTEKNTVGQPQASDPRGSPGLAPRDVPRPAGAPATAPVAAQTPSPAMAPPSAAPDPTSAAPDPTSAAPDPTSAAPDPTSAAPSAAGPSPTAAAAAAPAPPRYDARASLEGLKQMGSLSSKAVRLALKGLAEDATACYEPAARAASWQKSPTVVKVKMEIDEDGRGARVDASGGPPGLADCVAAAARKIRSRARPDTGIVELTFALRFSL